ncbi:unnamed protein product [Rhizophagus irregularis]|nr:unnamed protein product [Rhizophagus irregularis]
MASSSTPNISTALNKGDDLDTAMDRAFYFEPVSHALKRYCSFSLTEEDITRTVEKHSGDGEQFTNLLIEHTEASSMKIPILAHLLIS